jgi:hypothetical protein
MIGSVHAGDDAPSTAARSSRGYWTTAIVAASVYLLQLALTVHDVMPLVDKESDGARYVLRNRVTGDAWVPFLGLLSRAYRVLPSLQLEKTDLTSGEVVTKTYDTMARVYIDYPILAK